MTPAEATRIRDEWLIPRAPASDRLSLASGVYVPACAPEHRARWFVLGPDGETIDLRELLTIESELERLHNAIRPRFARVERVGERKHDAAMLSDHNALVDAHQSALPSALGSDRSAREVDDVQPLGSGVRVCAFVGNIDEEVVVATRSGYGAGSVGDGAKTERR